MEKLQFEVSAGLKSIIGKDLITNDVVAIFELVKNSYDAGSSRVDIVFETGFENIIKDNQYVKIPYKEKVYIVDNGKGMTYADIIKKWLKVAYSAKSDGSEDYINKTYAGNKGVGRFSCDRLGSKLRLQSKSKSSNKISNVYVDWGDFDKNLKAEFSSIDILYEEKEYFDYPAGLNIELDQGVIIEISSLREQYSWNNTKLIDLKRSLIKLIDPFGDTKKDFDVYINDAYSLEHDKETTLQFKNNEEEDNIDSSLINGKIRNTIIDTLKYKTTYLEVKLDNGYYYSTLVDRGDLIYKIKEPVEKNSFLNNSSFKAEVFFLNRASKATFTRRMGTQPIKYGSLFLFRNGFRVFPIGEEDNDFWGLNRRKQQGHSRYLGNRDILGKVEVRGNEDRFKEASSRDMGLIKTDASEELKRVILNKVIRKLEAYVVNIQWTDIYDKDFDTPERMHRDENKIKILDLVTKLSGSDTIELLEYNTELVAIFNEKSKHFEVTVEKLVGLAEKTSNAELFKLVKEASQRFDIEHKRALEAKKQADQEQELRREAENKARLESLRRAEEEVRRKNAEGVALKYKEESEKERSRNLFLSSMETSRDKEKLESFIHQLIIYSSATKDLINTAIFKIKNEKDNFSSESLLDVFSEILNNNERIITTSRFAILADFMLDSACIEENLTKYISQYLDEIITAYNKRVKIETIISDDIDFRIRFSPIEIGLIFDNLVSNSQKSRASKVTVEARVEKKDFLTIYITDDGRGISKGIDKARIFEKGYTSTDGSGLGLYHAKNQVEKIGGEILLDPEQPERGARFIIRIKK